MMLCLLQQRVGIAICYLMNAFKHMERRRETCRERRDGRQGPSRDIHRATHKQQVSLFIRETIKVNDRSQTAQTAHTPNINSPSKVRFLADPRGMVLTEQN